MDRMRWASWLNVLVGAWLVASPWMLGFAADDWAGTSNHVLIGGLVVVLAACSAVAPRRLHALSWINAAFGAWLLVAPWLVGYATTPAMVNSALSGVGIAVLALIRVSER